MKVDKPWGHFLQFVDNTKATVKILSLDPNEELSYQSHKYRDEFWHVISGNAELTLNDELRYLNPEQSVTIYKGDKHKVKNYSSSEPLKILEISTGHFDEEDIERFEDKYKRIQ